MGTAEEVMLPLYFLHQDLGTDNNKHVPGYEIIKQIESVISTDKIDGIQRIGGLWRIYINNAEEKLKLMTQGFTFKGIAVRVTSDNPYHSKYEDNQKEIQRGTKVIIQNIPLTIDNRDIKKMMEQFGVQILSEIGYEYELDERRRITGIKNGNRSIFLDTAELEAAPIPQFAHCGNWRCRIQYRGQPKYKKHCFNCFELGHVSRDCKNDRACVVCHGKGHREGSSDCPNYAPNTSVAFKGEHDVFSN